MAANWPKGLSKKAQCALESAGYTPETVAGVQPDDLVASVGISATAAEAVTKRPPPPEIEMIREITGRYPPKIIWDELVTETAAIPQEFLVRGWKDHVMGGGNPVNYTAWLARAKLLSRPPIVITGARPMPDMNDVMDYAEGMANATGTPWSLAMQAALNIKGNGL